MRLTTASAPNPGTTSRTPHPTGRGRVVLALSLLLLTVLLLGLGSWQVQRLFWKLDLIARVDARLAEAPVPAPPPSEWSNITREKDEYRRVTATGTFLHDKQVRVQAVTQLGAGFWILTPLQQGDGTTVLVNRGFVPSDYQRAGTPAPAAPVPAVEQVSGLMRMSEPGGAFLRSNDPSAGRWYSRDVDAIAAAKDLSNVAPYFIDADAGSNRPGGPVGGLTVVQFRNSHLVYAVTWYLLAIMSAGAAYALLTRRLE